MDKKLSLIINKVADKHDIDPFELGQAFSALWKDIGVTMNDLEYPTIYISHWGRFVPSLKKLKGRIEMAYVKLSNATDEQHQSKLKCYIEQMENSLKRLENEREKRKWGYTDTNQVVGNPQ